MTVFVIQQPTRNAHGWEPDFSSAEKFGKIQFVFDQSEKVYATPTPSKDKVAKLFKEQGFNHETDFILWQNLGDPMAMAAFMLAFCWECDLDIPFVKFLQWNRKRDENGVRDPKQGFYVPITFNRRKK